MSIKMTRIVALVSSGVLAFITFVPWKILSGGFINYEHIKEYIIYCNQIFIKMSGTQQTNMSHQTGFAYEYPRTLFAFMDLVG
jgi:hypothetical protein